MSEQNRETVRRLLQEVWTRGNVALLPELLAADSRAHPMPQLGELRGPDEYMQFIAVYKGAFQDMAFTIEDQFACGDKVATRWVSRVTDTNRESGDQQIAIDGITITHHDSGGRIVGEWGVWDTHSLLESAVAPQIYDQLAIKI
ncbi:MAG: ester cyclase [Pseudomonadales bacterium]|nr:ester cyclase [Halieaceae bacterium]MCP5165206.1 ester cyclase [Pseudomonadales bacterium]MCP5189920.1 ester cyclase [Pseudomonadales bacterium]MCP5203481.1 ester cyclase [Pseudomonadales bacterium]